MTSTPGQIYSKSQIPIMWILTFTWLPSALESDLSHHWTHTRFDPPPTSPSPPHHHNDWYHHHHYHHHHYDWYHHRHHGLYRFHCFSPTSNLIPLGPLVTEARTAFHPHSLDHHIVSPISRIRFSPFFGPGKHFERSIRLISGRGQKVGNNVDREFEACSTLH